MAHTAQADTTAAAVEELLSLIPDVWAPFERDEMSSAAGDALDNLVRAGLVELRRCIKIRAADGSQSAEATIEVTGERGAAEAIEAVKVELRRRWPQAIRQRGDGTHYLDADCEAVAGEKWRLTAIGADAKGHSAEGESIPIDFAMQKGFFAGREAVAGSGRLVSITESAPPAANLPMLSEREKEVYDFIKTSGPVTGKEITAATGIEQSVITAHIVPALKRHGLKNKKGRGYFFP